LTSLAWVPSGGKAPRHFVIDPTGEWLFAANQGSDNISLFRVDPKSGRLTPTDHSLAVVSPVCIEFVSFKEVAKQSPEKTPSAPIEDESAVKSTS